MAQEQRLRKKILDDILEYYGKKSSEKFSPGESRIQYAGAVYDEHEVIAMVNSILDGWLGLSRSGREFELLLSKYIGVSRFVLANSGSSASLLAVAVLTSQDLRGHMEKGDEVVTPAMTFPTTFNSICINGLQPVLLDVELGTCNINPADLQKALSPKTKAILVPHAFGVPNEMDAIIDFAEDHDLYVIEDNCDALGSEYDGKKTGSFGFLSTYSFYPAHHITMGEGGAISIRDDDEQVYRILKSLRDWGRACYCEHDETRTSGACGKRFDFKINGVPYDHRYMYTHMGYNLKPLDLQAAMGIEQLKKLPDFVKKRRHNFERLYEEFKKHEDCFILPSWPAKSTPSWFCFPVTLREGTPFKREELTTFLEKRGVQTRLFFAGNITRQPAYGGLKVKKVGGLRNSDRIMTSSFFLGVYPRIDDERMNYIIDTVEEFMRVNQR